LLYILKSVIYLLSTRIQWTMLLRSSSYERKVTENNSVTNTYTKTFKGTMQLSGKRWASLHCGIL